MPSGSKVVVTGGLGFIGSHFVRRWLRTHPKDHVVNLDIENYAADAKRLEDGAKGARYSFVAGDIADGATVRRALADADILVHFAAETHVDRSIADPSAFVRTNVLGTQVLLEAALGSRLRRFHHVSTDEVYGQLALDSRKRFHEDSPYRPRSPYAASKAASDHLVRAYHATYGLNATITHSSNAYGPWQHVEKFIPRLVTNALDGRPMPLYGDGRNVRDWVFVEDCSAAIERVVVKGRVGETYNIGGDAERSNIEVARVLCRLTGRPESSIEFVTDRPGHDLRYALDAAKIRKELGWQPTTDFEAGLQATVEWYRGHESWWRPHKNATEKTYAKMTAQTQKRVAP